MLMIKIPSREFINPYLFLSLTIPVLFDQFISAKLLLLSQDKHLYFNYINNLVQILTKSVIHINLLAANCVVYTRANFSQT